MVLHYKRYSATKRQTKWRNTYEVGWQRTVQRKQCFCCWSSANPQNCWSCWWGDLGHLSCFFFLFASYTDSICIYSSLIHAPSYAIWHRSPWRLSRGTRWPFWPGTLTNSRTLKYQKSERTPLLRWSICSLKDFLLWFTTLFAWVIQISVDCLDNLDYSNIRWLPWQFKYPLTAWQLRLFQYPLTALTT